MRLRLFCTILILLIYSCKKEIQRPSWDVDIAAPIVFSSMNLSNLIPDSLLNSDSNQAVSLILDESIFKLELDSILQLPDTTLADTFVIPPPFPSINVNPGQTIISTTENQRFNLGGAELKEVDIESGIVSFSLSSTISQPTIYEYKIFSATLNSQPFSITINVPAGSQSNPAVVNGTYDFSGYHFDLRGDFGAEFNKYKTQVKVILDPAASPVTVTNSDKVIVNNTFSQMKPSYAEGYFGSEQYELNYQETSFGFFNRIISGSLDLDQVEIQFSIINGIGVDARVSFDTLLSKNNRTSNEVLLNHSIIGSPININRAVNNGITALPSSQSFLMNNGNSNVDLFLENLPDVVGYALDISINPLGNVSGHSDFLYKDKTFDVRVNANIPLNLIANALTLVDTVNFTLDEEQASQINYGVLHVFAENGFPLETTLQIYLLNSSNVVIDSVMSPNIISSAFTNTSNIVTALRNSRLDITLSESQLDHLKETKRFLLKAKFSTSNLTQHVQLYDFYFLNLKLTSEFNYTIE